METRRGARGLSQQGHSSRAPEALVDDSDSMANCIICTDNPGNSLSTLTSTDEQHPFELVREATENCGHIHQYFDQMEGRGQRIRSRFQLIDPLLEEIRSDCANLEKSREMQLQCPGIPEPGALCLRLKNTKQRKKTSAQAEQAEQQDRMEHERELNQQRMRDLERTNEMHAPEMRDRKENARELEVEKEGVQQELENVAASLKKWREKAEVLTAALMKSEIAKGHLMKHLDMLKGKSGIQAGTGTDLQSTPGSLEDSSAVSHEEHERELNQQRMRDLERTNEMHAPEMRNRKENARESEVEKEGVQEELEHGAASLKKWREKAEVLTAALMKSEIAKGHLMKHLDMLKGKSGIQAGTGTDLQSTPGSLNDSSAVSHEEVSQEQDSSSWSLEQLSPEPSGQGHALARVRREEELLGQKADLEGRLAATEWLRQDLSRQLAETRSAKESLESRLFAAQQQIFQLEGTRNLLEAQVLTVTQAKEVIEGQVKCLQRELEAERALRRQEREDTAQQLLQAEQQHHKSLRLQGTAQQLGIKKLLQDLASERKRHRAEMKETLEQWEKEKAEREQEHRKVQFEMRQKVATLLAQQEELMRFENAKREVLLEEQKEKSALSEALLQTQEELSRAHQQVQQLRQEVKEQQEKSQTIKANLQAELQEAHSDMQAAQRRHEEELQGLKEEMNLLLEQREALQKQVGELTSQLAACRESQETTVQRAQQDVREAQEMFRQQLLEIEHAQKMLKEVENQTKELQVHLEYLEREWSQWEEVAQQNSELQASVNALESEKDRLILSLEEKHQCLRRVEKQNLALNNHASPLFSALKRAEEFCSEQRIQMQEFNTQIWALQDLQMEASQATREKQLLQELHKSGAGECALRDSVDVLEAEVSELRVRLQSSDDKALALAIQCKAVELELRKTQVQRDNLRARSLELQELEESEKELWKAAVKHISRETALEKEATERREEAVTLCQEVASLKRKLENLEKDRMDVPHERELNQQRMRDLERRNEMHAPEMQNRKENGQESEVEKEGMQEELEHGAASLKKWREKAEVLTAALMKSEIAKGHLMKHLDMLKGKSGIQAGTGTDLQSTPGSLEDSSAVSHEEQAIGAQVEQLLRGSGSSLEPKQPVVSAEEEKKERLELTSEPRRSGKQVEPERRRIRIFRRVFCPDYFMLPVHKSAHRKRLTSTIEDSSSSSGEQQPSC
ncbi:centrosome-associated protein CEP250-like isoform X1 [Vidua chalybeata]|uniref:centrosome-associated protein CEP250-like isoform X1 n=1 Tax=Vidua chalybeata TaxID=81927 RepID=UPI0023A7FD6E|nr:centrosome-associated protein CEP250-like isoform X1 [Vidua chalybeata]